MFVLITVGMKPYRYLTGFPKAKDKEIKTLLSTLGIENLIDKYLNEISGGQRQRVAIARALVNNPKIIMADEPTGNLDTKSSVEIMAMFKELYKQGKTIILVTHEPDIAENAKRIITVRDGKIV